MELGWSSGCLGLLDVRAAGWALALDAIALEGHCAMSVHMRQQVCFE